MARVFLPSPGKYALADACGFAWSIHAPKWPRVSDSDFAGWGKAVSQVAECLAVWGDAPVADVAGACNVAPEKLHRVAKHLRLLLEQDDATWRAAERGLSYDPETDEVRVGVSRSAPDLVFRRRDGWLTVRDYKSGYMAATHSDVRANPQLRAYAYFAHQAYGADEVRVELAHVSDEGIIIDAAEFDAFELAVIAGEVRDRLARPYHEAVPRPGRHCSAFYCPIVSECPATKRAMAQVDAAAEAADVPMTAVIQSAQHARDVRNRAKAIARALETIEMAAKDYVKKTGPVELSPGLWWGARQHDGKRFVDAASTEARRIIERHLGDFAAAAAIDWSTSIGALEAGAKSVAVKGKAAALARALFAELEEAGALKRGAPYVVVEEFKRQTEEA
jgi:hypothetical protein